MKQKVLVLGLSAYDFKNENQQQMQGAHVYYVDDFAVNENSKRGSLPIKISANHDVFVSTAGKKFPALCDLDMRLTPTTNGAGKVNLVSFTYVAEHKIF